MRPAEYHIFFDNFVLSNQQSISSTSVVDSCCHICTTVYNKTFEILDGFKRDVFMFSALNIHLYHMYDRIQPIKKKNDLYEIQNGYRAFQPLNIDFCLQESWIPNILVVVLVNVLCLFRRFLLWQYQVISYQHIQESCHDAITTTTQFPSQTMSIIEARNTPISCCSSFTSLPSPPTEVEPCKAVILFMTI